MTDIKVLLAAERYLEQNFYRVWTDRYHIKHIGIEGYFYKTDPDPGKRNKYRLLIYQGFNVNAVGFSMKQYAVAMESAKEYIEEQDEKLFLVTMKDWVKDAMHLPLRQVNRNTPDGWYYCSDEELTDQKQVSEKEH